MERADYSKRVNIGECGINWQICKSRIKVTAFDDNQSVQTDLPINSDERIHFSVMEVKMPKEIKERLIKNFVDNMGI